VNQHTSMECNEDRSKCRGYPALEDLGDEVRHRALASWRGRDCEPLPRYKVEDRS